MSNEEKILGLLQTMQANMTTMQANITTMQASMTTMQADLAATKADMQGITARLDKLEAGQATMKQELKAEISHEIRALIEVDVLPKFGALTAGQDLIIEKMVEQEDLDELRADTEGRLDVLEAVVKRLSREVEKLKKAQ